jgi:hypothetical protein
VTLANPLALWGLLLAAPIVALYVLRATRRRVRVATTMFWGRVLEQRRRARPWERFRQHASLWWQLLALLLLVLALADPALPSARGLGSSVVFLLDTSASMRARAPAPSRWEALQSRVEGHVRALGPFDEAAIVISSPAPRVLVPPTQDHERLISALRALSPSPTEGSLLPAAETAMALVAAHAGRVAFVLTDGSDPSTAEAMRAMKGAVLETLGQDAANVGITTLSVRRGGIAD